MDNLFVFILVFNYFKTPVAYQNKVLTYGIATAAVLRLVLIVAGVDIGGLVAGVASGQRLREVMGHALGPTACWSWCCQSPLVNHPALHPASSLTPVPRPRTAVERFEPVLLLFAGILIFSSYKLLV